jgi:Protein of unknown function (DUF3866)
MIRLRRGTVVAVGPSRPGALELVVDVGGASADALAYPPLTGPVAPGDAVLLNATAVELGLGTGGRHLVVAVGEAAEVDVPGPGRVVKARYTPLQTAVPSVEETHRDLIESSPGLRGTPVVVAPLHSMLGPVAAGARAAGAGRIAYVMTDGAALPGAFSQLVPALRDAGLVDGWITCGQSFGGELDAVTVWTALLAAVEVLSADVVVVADGPGNLGTETTWGVSALAGGNAMAAANVLGGRPVGALRISFADPRERHHGVSHHSLTILGKVCPPGAHVAVPALFDEAERTAVYDALRAERLEERHQLVEVDGRPALSRLDEAGIRVESMGRSPQEDPPFFLAAGAAGTLAGRMAAGARPWREARG